MYLVFLLLTICLFGLVLFMVYYQHRIFVNEPETEKYFVTSNGIYEEDADYPCTLPEDHLTPILTFCEEKKDMKERLSCYKSCLKNSPSLADNYPRVMETITDYERSSGL